MITIICITLVLSVVLYGDWATEAKYSFVLFLKMGKLPLNKKNLHLKRNTNVICGNYVITYPERTGLIKTEYLLLNPKTIIASDKMSLLSGYFQKFNTISRKCSLPF